MGKKKSRQDFTNQPTMSQEVTTAPSPPPAQPSRMSSCVLLISSCLLTVLLATFLWYQRQHFNQQITDLTLQVQKESTRANVAAAKLAYLSTATTTTTTTTTATTPPLTCPEPTQKIESEAAAVAQAVRSSSSSTTNQIELLNTISTKEWETIGQLFMAQKVSEIVMDDATVR